MQTRRLSNREEKGELRQFGGELEWREGSRDDKIRSSPWTVELDLAEGLGGGRARDLTASSIPYTHPNCPAVGNASRTPHSRGHLEGRVKMASSFE
jgi:hypothetical protein